MKTATAHVFVIRIWLSCLALGIIAISLPLHADPFEPEGFGFSGEDIRLVPPVADTHVLAGELEPRDRIHLALDTLDGLHENGSVPATVDSALVIPKPQQTRRSGVSKDCARLATAGLLLIPLDRMLVRSFPRVSDGERVDGFTRVINELGSGEVLLATIGVVYLLGDRQEKDTAGLALAALVNAGIATEGLKMLTGRERPTISNDATRFHGPTINGSDYKSFPSGHTAAAFAVATVLADRNPDQRSLYYGLATAVGLSRVRLSAHFPSDVLVGAAIGIHSGRNALTDGPRLFSLRF